MTTAIIYTRFSPRPNAKECDSCEKQQERCMKFLEGKVPHGGVILCFADKSVSGDKLPRRGLADALIAIEPGAMFVVDRSDRLSRSMLVNLTIRGEIKGRGGVLQYADDSPCSDSPEDTFVQDILSAVSALELARIRLNTKRGIARNRAAGKKINSRIPTGMMEDPENPGMLVKCQKEREGILSACRLRRNTDFNRGRIALWLTESLGHYRGKPWDGRLVDKIIARHSFWADPVDGKPEDEPEFF